MSEKTRSNYKSVCLKFECINRNVVCDKCNQFSKYIGKVEITRRVKEER